MQKRLGLDCSRRSSHGPFRQRRSRRTLSDVRPECGDRTRVHRRVRGMVGTVTLGAFFLFAGLAIVRSIDAEVISLKNGLQLQGNLTKVGSLNQNPLIPYKGPGGVDVLKIVLVDDGLRRTFVSSNQVAGGGLAPDADTLLTKIPIAKRIAQQGRRLGSVGPILEVTPFDEFGNRVFSMQSARGRLDVIQGISEITPLYCKVEGLAVSSAVIWDMRISTSSIPRETLTRVLLKQIDQTDSRERLKVVTLYIQAKRYRDALVELDRVIHDFPDLKEVARQRQRLNQLVTADVIREIKLRKAAGQHRQAYSSLKDFREKDIAGEALLEVGDLLKEYEEAQRRGHQLIELLTDLAHRLEGHKARVQMDAMVSEVKERMSMNTLDRLADFERLADDEKMGDDQKMALACSGWLMGSGEGIENLATAAALWDIRDAVRSYLRSDNQVEREEALRQMRELEGSSPGNIAKIIALMRPPLDVEFPAEGVPGLLERTISVGASDRTVRYYVQVPPEYDPDRRYPCVVTLHGSGSSPLSQIDWWAGPYDPKRNLRMGQATRRGYIVIAPEWTRAGQTRYEYSVGEHAAVLGALRDAARRLNIDSDRVFLSGHSLGGDAAWDIGLAHPDLWAGVLPITATADKYISRYWKNGRELPLYFVAGQLDSNKIADNARDLDRYLKYAHFDAMYVEYRGRGDEHFQDEIQRMFEWMNRNRRTFAKREFECTTMRPWDQFFWWVELAHFPTRSMVLPNNWPGSKVREGGVEASVTANNAIRVKTAAAQVTIWLSPEWIDFDRRISFGGRTINVTPELEVLLEDVRTRGDRQHPFWAKHVPTAGRR